MALKKVITILVDVHEDTGKSSVVVWDIAKRVESLYDLGKAVCDHLGDVDAETRKGLVTLLEAEKYRQAATAFNDACDTTTITWSEREVYTETSKPIIPAWAKS